MQKSTLRAILLSLCGLLGLYGNSHACDLSSLSLVSVTGTGPYVITVNLCIGMGVTGATKGGDQRTASVFFGFFDNTSGFSILGFTPAQMVSPAPPQATVPPSCTMTGITAGPNTTFGTVGSVVYPMPPTAPCTGASGTSYGCVTTTALCGPRMTSCSTYTFTVNQIPDSMRAFGVEGGGNPVGGCYPNADMVVVFSDGPTAVSWGTVEAISTGAGVEVRWTTHTETNADYFIVERADESNDFQWLGDVAASGNSNGLRRYSFFDNRPLAGKNRYRLVEVDRNGAFNESAVVEVNYDSPSGLAWGQVGPNPASEQISLSFYSPVAQSIQVEVVDVQGKLVSAQTIEAAFGGNVATVDVRNLQAGVHFLRLKGDKGSLVRRIVKA